MHIFTKFSELYGKLMLYILNNLFFIYKNLSKIFIINKIWQYITIIALYINNFSKNFYFTYI